MQWSKLVTKIFLIRKDDCGRKQVVFMCIPTYCPNYLYLVCIKIFKTNSLTEIQLCIDYCNHAVHTHNN